MANGMVSEFTRKIQNSDGTYSYERFYFETHDQAITILDDIKDGPQDGTLLHKALTDMCADIADNGTLAKNAYNLAKGVSSSFVFETAATLISGTSTNVGAMRSYTLVGDTSKPGYKVGDNLYVVNPNVSDFWISAVGTTQPSGVNQASVSAFTTGQDINGAKFWVKWGSRYVTIVATETKTNLIDYLTSSAFDNAIKDYAKKTDPFKVTGDVTGEGTVGGGVNLTLKDTGVSPDTYSAVAVDAKGRVTVGQQMVVFATSRSDSVLSKLAVGGIEIITEE